MNCRTGELTSDEERIVQWREAGDRVLILDVPVLGAVLDAGLTVEVLAQLGVPVFGEPAALPGGLLEALGGVVVDTAARDERIQKATRRFLDAVNRNVGEVRVRDTTVPVRFR